ncbi:type I restriction enzyme HsdR N-terminal domain-containing protein [Bacillus paranthracis]|uniref:Type I restriction enzyme R protein N-terminal domain-containing protein n=1 Tax=Bacillus cereus (strain Q1) TaxID=361100 RepID=B9IU76_BACCQ|nr:MULTISPECIES: type I restriction enzyme HsdR N-terminal domain-containing protein [Bacillus cereus group]ACM11772.1 conserved hypothetical protein [Bacillus cereus Q1]MBY5228175.1 hypothetical protein [Bacillus paranthracis]MCY9250745.1 type I restriction enzyme HsdR N-terminal domain-containing protein [Bacillus paranthracis]MDA1497805.1 type I restriction enzyme HsdR N-terminal domain-containing protein [Bacillus cereus group sp. TH41-1LC]MDA1684133.1 type I restriction enzyme HsdR N-term
MLFKVDWDEYPENYILTTNLGEKWIKYPYHNRKMYKAYPEELVRLQTIHFLFKEMKVPFLKGAIEVEVKMSEFDEKYNGRADIVVYAEDEEFLVPILIVECKANHIALTEEVFEQAKRYDEVLFANNIMITNGKLLKLYSWKEKEKKYIELNKIPTYQELAKEENLHPISEIG